MCIRKLKTIRALAKDRMKILPLKEKGKAPILGGGVYNATNDLKELKDYFRKHPSANYGIATGQVSNLIVVDVDGERGKQSLRKLIAEHGELPKTVVVKTGKGRHYWFRPGRMISRNSAGRLGQGIDIRGDGGYIVGPGSVHESGRLYRFLPGRAPCDVKIAEAPKWLRKAVASSEKSQIVSSVPVIPLSDIERARAYIDSAVRRELERLGKAPKHQRNDTLNRCAFKLGQLEPYGMIHRPTIIRDLAGVATRIGLEDSEIVATITSGIDAGSKHPRPIPFLKPMQDKDPDAEHLSLREQMTQKLSQLGETDTDNAQRLASRYAGQIIYSKGRGWLAYKHGRWLPEAAPECIELAKATARQIASETQYLATDQAKAARAHFAKASLSKGALDRMLDLAKGLVNIADSELDADPWLFNVQNGTIDLRTGYIEKHDPSDLLTQISPIHADGDAECPLFKTFLKRITNGDKRLMRYIRKAVGYSLTGSTKEQVFFFCYGQSGSNGKSTLINLVRDMLGDYGCHTPTETLMTKQYDNAISNDQARLAGVRMVTAVETNFNRQLDEAKIKAMTGGEKITARFMRQDYFEFTPAFKLWLAANDRPRVRGTDTALWRRIRVVPFNMHIPESEKDLDLPSKLRQEWPGILAWAVRGSIDWQKEGLVPPPAACQAATDWSKAADHLKLFVIEVLEFDALNRIAAQVMHDQYSHWCGRNGETPLDMKAFKLALMTEHNIHHKRTKQGSEWTGVRFRS
jgi:putative DNA primase/helicase